MLKLSEEIVLLALDAETGEFVPLPERALELAVAGSLLCELFLKGKIDADVTKIFVADSSPTLDLTLDEALSAILPADDKLTTQKALARLAVKGEHFVKLALDSLVEKKVLEAKEKKFLWVLKERIYPVADGERLTEVCARVRHIVTTPDEIPDERDAIIISLMSACDLFASIYGAKFAQEHRERIELVSKMNLIAQSVSRAINDIRHAILEAIAFSGV